MSTCRKLLVDLPAERTESALKDGKHCTYPRPRAALIHKV